MAPDQRQPKSIGRSTGKSRYSATTSTTRLSKPFGDEGGKAELMDRRVRNGAPSRWQDARLPQQAKGSTTISLFKTRGSSFDSAPLHLRPCGAALRMTAGFGVAPLSEAEALLHL